MKHRQIIEAPLKHDVELSSDTKTDIREKWKMLKKRTFEPSINLFTPNECFGTSEELDYSIVRIQKISDSMISSLTISPKSTEVQFHVLLNV